MRQVLIFTHHGAGWEWSNPQGIQAIVLPKRSKRAIESELIEQSNEPVQRGESIRLDAARRQLLDYLAGTRQTFDVPLDLSQGRPSSDRSGGCFSAYRTANSVRISGLPNVWADHSMLARSVMRSVRTRYPS